VRESIDLKEITGSYGAAIGAAAVALGLMVALFTATGYASGCVVAAIAEPCSGGNDL